MTRFMYAIKRLRQMDVLCSDDQQAAWGVFIATCEK
jgi:hypothetical protein